MKLLIFRLFICSLLALFAAPKSFAASPEELRAFLGEIIRNPESGENRSAQLREALIRNNEILADLLVDENATRLLQEAGLSPLLPSEADRSAHLAFQNILGDLLSRQSQFEPYNVQTRAAITRFQQNPRAAENSRELARVIRNMPESMRRTWINSIPDAMFHQFEQNLNQWATQIEFSKSPAIQRLKQSIASMEIRGTKPEEINSIADTLSRYFDRLPAPRKRTMMHSWLKLPARAPPTQQAAAIIQDAGPGVQKIFQLLAGQTTDQEMQLILKEMQSNVKPFNEAQARAILERNLGRPIREVFVEYPERPFSAGTIGQVYRARLRSSGQEVAVKIQRPGVRERLDEDMQSLRSIMREDDPAREIIEKMAQHFHHEMDLPQEARNLDEMLRYRHIEKGVNVPSRISEFPIMNDVLVMEMARGKPLTKLSDLDPAIRARALYNAIQIWFEEAMFESGFFHGDAHGGNLMLHVDRALPAGFEINFIDAGSVEHLSLEQRRKMVHYAIGVITGSKQETLTALRDFAAVPEARKAEFNAKVEAILISNSESRFAKANEILMEAGRMGAVIDSELMVFVRSLFMFEQQLNEANAVLIARNPGARPYSMVRAFAFSALKRSSRELPAQLFSNESRATATVQFENIRQALAGARSSLDEWFERKAATSRAWRAARSCGEFFRLLP